MIRMELIVAHEDRQTVIAALRPLIEDADRMIELDIGLHPASLHDRVLREQVTGKTDRLMLILQLGRDEAKTAVIAAIEDLHLQVPLRWISQPVADHGEIGE